jgi:hypothetical protein
MITVEEKLGESLRLSDHWTTVYRQAASRAYKLNKLQDCEIA